MRRKTRTLLTVLGVVIGTASIVVMLSLGIAMGENFKKEVEQMGSLNIIEVRKPYGDSPGMSKDKIKLDDKAVEVFQKIKGVKAVMPMKSNYMRVVSGKFVADVNVIGVKPETLEAFGMKIEEGKLLTSTEKNGIIFGSEIKGSFYNPKSKNMEQAPQTLKILTDKILITSDSMYGEKRSAKNLDSDSKPAPTHPVKGIGVLKNSGDDQDYNVYMNIKTLEEFIKEDRRITKEKVNPKENDKYNSIKVKTQDIEVVSEIQKMIKDMGYETFSLTEILDSMRKTSNMMQSVLGGIGAVSLLVAAIGITNTMVMSIYERTREIGVMKVLGARLKDIKKLFLIEASMIGFFGGIAGLIFSYTVSFLINHFGPSLMADSNMMGVSGSADQKISVIPIGLAVGGLVFSTFIGLISGYSPAKRAMKLSALQAIKNE